MKLHLDGSFLFNRENCILETLHIRSTKIKFVNICPKFFIVKILKVLIVYCFRWQLVGVHFKFSYSQEAKVGKASLENITVLKASWLIDSNKINACRLIKILETCWFFNNHLKAHLKYNILSSTSIRSVIKVVKSNEFRYALLYASTMRIRQ